MKSIAATALMASAAMAWPMNMEMLTGPLQEGAREKWLAARDLLEAGITERQAVASPQGAGALPRTPPPFDAQAQLVSTSGQYKFVAPGPTDARGECPGLNAMANHGYIPRNGKATIEQFVDGTEAAFGMGRDLGRFLSLYGAVVDGDGMSWSIGGVPRTGILGSHNVSAQQES